MSIIRFAKTLLKHYKSGDLLDNRVVLEIDQFLILSNLADTTKDLYRHYLGLWAGYLVENIISARKAKPLDLAAWIGLNPGWSDSTRHSAVASVRAYYAWKWGKKHPVLSFNVTRREAPPQRTPDIGKLDKLLSSLDTSKARGRMLLAMITLMLDTGLRRAEICRLELSRLDLIQGVLWCRVKGSKWKPKRFFDYTRSCLLSWMADRKQIARPECRTVFCAVFGPNKGCSMGGETLKTIFRRLGESSGIGAFSPHDLRRSFATLSIMNGAPSRLVQAQGGWENLEQLERYTQAINLKAMAPYSPVDNLMGLNPKKPV